jgi:hypothetical protein
MAFKKKKVTFAVSANGYKNMKSFMKKFGFTNEELFVRYCMLKTIRTKASANLKEKIDKELKIVLDRR